MERRERVLVERGILGRRLRRRRLVVSTDRKMNNTPFSTGFQKL